MAKTYGNTHTYVMERLQRDNHELYGRVLAGELTPHRAAIEAGWRPRQLSVRVDDAARLVASLRRNTTPEFVAEVGRLITEQG